MNGARALVETLVGSDVTVCFSNPGTSEMHFVAALDQVRGMRAVLGLFEGVVTGAADGYGRMAGTPAATLLHLGPGLGNGLANLHNARRANTPIVNIVGDHAIPHKRLDAPLESDIDSVAHTVSGWVRRSDGPGDVGRDAAEAVAAACAPPGRVATLILPADASWSEGAEPSEARPRPTPPAVNAKAVAAAARMVTDGAPTALLLGGPALLERGTIAASRVAAACGVKLLAETFPARIERGAGRPAVERLSYLAEFVEAQLAGVRHLILAGARAPVSFFAYPGRPSELVPEGCAVHVLADASHDVVGALEVLADEVAPGTPAVLQPAVQAALPSGALTAESVSTAIGTLLPEDAIVVDEAQTSGLWAPGATAGAPPHDWLTLTGGAIGQGLPVATGAAIACPGRRVVCLEADGSAMYTLQALWTQAREGLDVTTVIYSNRSYAILNMELARVGAGSGGPKAHDMLDLSRPDLDFVALAKGMGVPASRPADAAAFADAFRRAVAEPGPHLIEAVVPSAF
jgi:acetolactate synthase-1/2/3 large subunit